MTDWEVRWHPAPGARIRLLCLPHAGGGALAYRAWARALAPDIEVVAIRLPGRESRFREEPFSRLGDLVPGLVKDLAPLLAEPHAWFGHSMGALIAFEACRASRALGLGRARRLLVSGRPAPHLPLRGAPVHAAPMADLVARLRANGGTPDEVLEDDVAMAALLPMLRADYSVAETYAHRPDEPLDCPLSVFGGEQDPLVTPQELAAWRRHSARGCTVRTYPGGHFYLHEEPAPLLRVIESDLLQGEHCE
ncbi:thioesterase II family protein [Streptomyces sp. NPDC018693]|uniref:thioesterase II family protein n=1 Tax=unclassified Streptomyces TaxID=2593676 RepID=UPI00379FAC02